MTIAEVDAAIAARRALGQKVFGVRPNPQNLLQLVQELPTATDPGTYACLAVTNGVRSFIVAGARCVPRLAVPLGTIAVVSTAPSDVEA